MFTCFLHLESGEFWLSLLDMSQVLHEWVYPWFPDMQQKPRKQVVVYLFAESMSRRLYTYIYLHPVSGAGVSGEWWQLVTVIHDEGDGWYLVSDNTLVIFFWFSWLIQLLPSKCYWGVTSAISCIRNNLSVFHLWLWLGLQLLLSYNLV
jgi:hypothetical protein